MKSHLRSFYQIILLMPMLTLTISCTSALEAQKTNPDEKATALAIDPPVPTPTPEPTPPINATPTPIPSPTPSPTPTPTPPLENVGRFGPGPRSGMPWFSGQWVTGGDDRLLNFEKFRNMGTDSVTQSINGMTYWYQHAGCDSETDCDTEFSQSPANFTPGFRGIFAFTGWKGHIWGGYPASVHRTRLIHLGWMDAIPSSVGNGSQKNPRIWYDIKNGAGDKYFFLLGRKFAYLDEQNGDTHYPMTIDLAYEWTLTKHASYPGGTYTLADGVHETFRDFPYGWARLVRVFKEGYRYQRGHACNYRFSWRPQMVFSVNDKNGDLVRAERMWPNDIANWEIASDVKINGTTVIPHGPIGAQADIVGVSWHDNSQEMVHGSSIAAPGNNWSKILNGFTTHWGLQEVASFAKAKKVVMALPEWGALRAGTHRPSAFPGDVYRLTYYFLTHNLDVIAYENVFDQGTGSLMSPWLPSQPDSQDPLIVYRQLWHKP